MSMHCRGRTQAVRLPIKPAASRREPTPGFYTLACRRLTPTLLAQEQRFPEWVREYLRTMFPAGDVPGWVRDAMAEAGIDLAGVATDQPAPGAAAAEQKVGAKSARAEKRAAGRARGPVAAMEAE